VSVTTINETTRKARKVHHCGMCNRTIKPGEQYRVATNVFDGRIYDWHECIWCHDDGICAITHAWWGHPDDGVNSESAGDWAEEVAIGWPSWQDWRGQTTRRVSATERAAARAWLARVAGGEGE
jgi:hypothetical protein